MHRRGWSVRLLTGLLVAGAVVAAAQVTAGSLATGMSVWLGPRPPAGRELIGGFGFWVFATLAVVVGRWVRRNAEERARSSASTELAAATAVTEAIGHERARIARDLHDVVSHSLTLMTLQAGVAGRLLDSNPVAAARALDGVGELGMRASAELHQLLGLWDNPGDPAGDSTRPRPGQDLIGLVEQARRAVPNVTLTVRGAPLALAAETGEAAFRVLQEALTNASRFGEPGRPVDVTLTFAPDEVGLTVVNHIARTSSGRTWVGGGRGLTGMDQRVRGCGGTVTVQTTGDGLFTLSARLPVAAPASARIPSARRARAGRAAWSAVSAFAARPHGRAALLTEDA